MPSNKARNYAIFVFITVSFAFLFYAQAFAQTLEIDARDDIGFYINNQPLQGTIDITHDFPLSDSFQLVAHIDGAAVSLINNLGPYLPDPLSYIYETVFFDLNITRDGNTTETNFPPQDFNYIISLNFTCGNPTGASFPSQSCPPGCIQNGGSANGYPCAFEQDWPPSGTETASVTQTNDTCLQPDGTSYSCSKLTEIINMSYLLEDQINSYPDINPETVLWKIWSNNTNVQTSMRFACGYSSYPAPFGPTTQPNGWIVDRSLDFQIGAGGSARHIAIESFDGRSMGADTTQDGGGSWGFSENDPARTLYTEAHGNNPIQIGGVYKDGQYLRKYAQGSDGAFWDGMANLSQIFNLPESNVTGGYVLVYVWSPLAAYSMSYLPPNGPILCAWTNATDVATVTWNATATIPNNNATFTEPFAQQYTEAQLESLLQPPACNATSCLYQTINYDFMLIDDPMGTITLNTTFDSGNGTYTVNAATSNQNLSQNYTERVYLQNFTQLEAPPPGNHGLEIRLHNGSTIIGSDTVSFSTCDDADSDGFCEEINDCNDSSAEIYPGASEVCNGADDDCDNEIDEDFIGEGSVIGTPCGGQADSACAGIWVCTSDGQAVQCNSNIRPGDLKEVCENGIDDDCDGIIDETAADYGPDQTCGCNNGDTIQCGLTLGACEGQTGFRVCENNEWSGCRNEIAPSVEVCNGIDDDCDGTVDDVHEGTSVSASACGCFNNRAPQSEQTSGCDDVDNDCDGIIDEDLSCCVDGTTRQAPGTIDAGECRAGQQTCVGGSWGPCEGCVYAVSEVCADNLDNDCDGTIDESCSPEITAQLCSNGIKDGGEEGIDCGGPCSRVCQEQSLIAYIGISVAVIVVILLIALIQLKGKF